MNKRWPLLLMALMITAFLLSCAQRGNVAQPGDIKENGVSDARGI
ncbi:MAG: hypothetical protein C0P72_000245 [Clostridia bacterium]